MNKSILVFLSSVFIGVALFAQNFNLQNGVFEYDCSSNGVLYDSGGPNASYGGDENFEMVICPPLGSGLGINLTVITSELGQGDLMSLYDGGSTNAPLISTIPQPDVPEFQAGAVFQTSVNNTEGCMTIVFESQPGSSGNFSFQISCATKCQEVVSIVNTVPNETYDSIQDGNYINICLGDTFFVNSFGIYPENNISYIQDDATSDFVWNWGDNTPRDTFQTGFHVFDNPGGYVTQMSIFDQNGCRNYQDQILLVRVAPEPEFNTSWDSIVCLGQTANLSGLPQGTIQDGFIEGGTAYFIPPFYTGDTTFIPDGTGSSHVSSTFVTGFENSAIIEDCGDILEICMSLEHSFSGDLDIVLSCPNGQSIRIVQFGTGLGSTNFGEPWATGPVDGQTNDPTPGIPYEYCVSMNNNNFGTFASEAGQYNYTYTTVPSQNNGQTHTYTDSYFPPGTYLPVDDIAGLVGCPINGEWSLTFTDNLAADNGWLFDWTLDIAPCMYPDIDSFTMTYNFGVWDDDSTIIDFIGFNQIVVLPDTIASYTYNYTVTDNFGCEYSNTYDVTVRDVLTEIYGEDQQVCLGDTVQIGVNVLGGEVEGGGVCNYTLEMFDSFGDGWQGGNLQVILDGITIGTFAAQGAGSTETFGVQDGQTLTLSYSSGSFEGENSYNLLDNQGNVLFSDGPFPSTGNVFTTTATCPPPVFNGYAIEDVANIDTVCDLTLDMFDSFGDDWNGGFLNLTVNGTSIGNFSAQGSGSSETINLNLGDELSLNYTSGFFEFENTYQLLDASGNVLFSDGPAPQTGNVFTIVMTSDLCVSEQFAIYEWQPTSTSIFEVNGLNSEASVFPTTPTNYVVNTQLSNGCEFTDTIFVGFVSFDYSLTPDTFICSGDQIQLEASGSDSYEWTINNETLSATEIPNPIASPLATTPYYVILDSADCQIVDSVLVTVRELPSTIINDGINPIEFCQGTSTSLFAIDSIGWTFEWNGPESVTGYTIDINSEGAYELVFTDEFGCENSEGVDVVELDTATFNFGDLRTILCCNDDEVTLNPQLFVDNNINLNEVLWNENPLTEVTIASAGNNEIEISVLNVTAENGCSSTVTLSFETRCIEPEITSVDTVFSFVPYIFDVNHNEFDDTQFDYNWSVNDETSGEFTDVSVQNPEFLATEIEGIYTALVDVSANYTLANNEIYTCTETAEEDFRVVLVSEPRFPDAFTPNSDGINDVFFPVLDPLSEVTQFKVYNRWNQLIYDYTPNSNGWDGTYSGKEQGPGLYIYYCEIEKPDEKLIFKGTISLIR